MFTALMLTAVLGCKPYRPPHPPPPPPPVVWNCEGGDRVQRTTDGDELSRWVAAPMCRPQPVRLTRDPKPVRFGLTAS